MKRLRIAFLTTEYAREGFPDGGLANYLWKICPLLQDNGQDPVVFLLGQKNRKVILRDIPVIELKHPRLKPKFLRRRLEKYVDVIEQWMAARCLANTFVVEHAKRPFDIIQAASFRAVGNALLGKMTIPMVVRISSYTPVFRAAKGLKKDIAGHLNDWLEIRQMLGADAVFAPSQLFAGLLQRLEGISVSVLRSPFHFPSVQEDLSEYKKYLDGKTYILYFGKLNRMKGADVLAGALPVIFQDFPDIHVAFVGADNLDRDTGATYGAYVLRKVGRWKERTHLLGIQPRKSLVPIVKHAKIVVLPSRIDNYPNTCLEAQALGKIVVATRESSLDEMITDGETGFLADPGSTQSLARAIHRALSLSASQRRTMEKAIERLVETRDDNEIVNDLIRFYQKVIEDFRHRSGQLTLRELKREAV